MIFYPYVIEVYELYYFIIKSAFSMVKMLVWVEMLKLICLAKDHWWRFSTKNVHLIKPHQNCLYILVKGKKEEIWLNPVTKTPTPTEQSKKQRDNIKTPPKIDYTTIADRLRMVSWSNSSHPTGEVKPVYEVPFIFCINLPAIEHLQTRIATS